MVEQVPERELDRPVGQSQAVLVSSGSLTSSLVSSSPVQMSTGSRPSLKRCVTIWWRPWRTTASGPEGPTRYRHFLRAMRFLRGLTGSGSVPPGRASGRRL